MDTSVIREDTLIFNCIQGALNLTKNDTISKMLTNLQANKNVLVFCVCLIQGLLQSRQNLTCGGQQKWIPWGVSCIAQCLNEIINFKSDQFVQLADLLLRNVFSNYFDDNFDLNYVAKLLDNTIGKLPSREININNVVIPLPEDNIRNLFNY